MAIPQFQKEILAWYTKNKRPMPWRNTEAPYKILVSEVMLQQTQVARVIPKYEEFLKAFPTLEKLAKAPDRKILKIWQGLGYWKRALNLKKTAQIVMGAKAINSQMSSRSPDGMVSDASRSVGTRAQNPKSRRDFEIRSSGISLPSNPKALEALPGIGHYTARALACFAFGNTEAFVDTNIRRAYLHFFFNKRKEVADKEILAIAQKAINSLPKNITVRDWHYALFDYGATILKDSAINKQSKHYTKQSKFAGSFRSFRTKIVQFLLAQPNAKTQQKIVKTFLQKELQKQHSSFSTTEILSALLKDRLIKSVQSKPALNWKSQKYYSI